MQLLSWMHSATNKRIGLHARAFHSLSDKHGCMWSVCFLFLRRLSVIVACLCVLTGCDSNAREKTVITFFEAIAAGRTEEALELIDFSSAPAQLIGQNRDKTRLFLKEVQKDVALKGGLASVEIIDQTMSDDGKHIRVDVRLNYGDGSFQQPFIRLIQVDGHWKIDLSRPTVP